MEELVNYVAEIYGSENSIETKNELVNAKLLDILHRLGYSDSVSQIVIANAQQPASLIIIYDNLYRLFNNNHDSARNNIKNRIKDILNSFTIFKLSVENEPEKTLEEKIRRYFTNEHLDKTNLDRLISLLSQIIETNPLFSKETINIYIQFADFHKTGDLLQINNSIRKLLRMMDYTVNPIVNVQEIYHILAEYFAAKDCSLQVFENTYKKIGSKLKYYWTLAQDNNIPINEFWEDIALYIENIILEYRIARFFDAIEDNFENTDDMKIFITNHKISFNTYNIIANRIFKERIKAYIEENNNFTPSSVEDFFSQNKGLSRARFLRIINTENIDVYPDPILNPETGESLDREGNVLPNCPICWNLLNINIVGPLEEYRIERLPCGGLFHRKCLVHVNICPICGQEHQ